MLRILLLTPQLPYPPQQGTSLRNFYILCGLAQRHAVTLLSLVEENQVTEGEGIRPLLSLYQRLETVPVPQRTTAIRLWQLLTTRLPDMAHRLSSPAFDQKLRQLLTETCFDVVQIEGIELAPAISLVRAISPGSRIVFDNHNAETELQRRNMGTDMRQPRRWAAAVYSWVQVQRLRRFEGWACGVADGVTAVSRSDMAFLQALAPGARVTVIPNCIDVVAYQAEPLPAGDRPLFDLVFSGKMDYRPNVDAVLWFAEAVWPGIRRQRPSATWAIVGQKPHPRLARLRDVPGITVTGWVAEVRPYLFGAAVIVLPFRIGSGTRLKLIEAMAAGRAVVSTPVGAEGFPVQSGREMVLAETAGEMETAVLRLLNDPAERQRLGTAAQQFAQQYDWRVVMPLFESVYAGL